MSARSKRLYGPAAIPTDGSAPVVYTCPTGKVALVKSVRAVTGTSLGFNWTCGIKIGSTFHAIWKCAQAVNTQYFDADPDPVVLNAGDQLFVSKDSNSPAGTCEITFSGAELDA